MSAASSIQEGQVANAQGKASNDIAELNASNLERQAAARREAATLEDTRQVRRSEMALGSQIARGGASGAVSDVDVLADTAFQFAMDRNLILRQGLVESQGLLGQAGMMRAQGKFAKKVGKHKRTTSYVKAGGTILGGTALRWLAESATRKHSMPRSAGESGRGSSRAWTPAARR